MRREKGWEEDRKEVEEDDKRKGWRKGKREEEWEGKEGLTNGEVE